MVTILYSIMWGGSAVAAALVIAICLHFFCYSWPKEEDTIAGKILITLMGVVLALIFFGLFVYCFYCFLTLYWSYNSLGV